VVENGNDRQITRNENAAEYLDMVNLLF